MLPPVHFLTDYGPAGLLFAFLVAHALADFPLQGEYVAREKVRCMAVSRESWVIALTAHALIHGGAAWIVSGQPGIGAFEVAAHWLIDWKKGEGKFGALVDQGLHVACKVGYVVFLVLAVPAKI